MTEQAKEPTQKTPKGAQRKKLLGLDDDEGDYEIPIPTKNDVLSDLTKAARPPEKD